MLKGRILKPIPRIMSKNLTYIQHTLSENGKSRIVYVHRLVASAFIENSGNRPQVNHIDGDGTNNRAENLEWVTVKENSIHAVKVLGRSAWSKGVYGEKAPTARPVLQFDLKGNLVKRWGCGLDAVRDGGFDSSGISRSAQGKVNSHKGYIWKYEKPKNYRSKP